MERLLHIDKLVWKVHIFMRPCYQLLSKRTLDFLVDGAKYCANYVLCNSSVKEDLARSGKFLQKKFCMELDTIYNHNERRPWIEDKSHTEHIIFFSKTGMRS